MTALTLAASPLLLLAALLADLLRGGAWPTVRAVTFLIYYLLCETVGITASLLVWITSAVWEGRSPDRFHAWNFRLQKIWAAALFAGATRIYGIRLEVEGHGDSEAGPLLVFMRHASIADTLLPAILLSNRHGWRLRYVMKRELLWDPCLDVVGQRLPNVFVRRDSGDSAAEIAAIRRLATDLGPDEGILIYPEGTRFTPRKRERVLARLDRSGDPRLLAKARELRHVLPPRLGGPLGLIDACPGADVLFVAHVGFDGAATLADLWYGRVIGRRVRVRLWRVPAAQVPADREARIDWLYAEWARLDAWIDAARAGSGNLRIPKEAAEG
jgi:1-acyl-sn-glycerol-3-phosphate acyltransferase